MQGRFIDQLRGRPVANGKGKVRPRRSMREGDAASTSHHVTSLPPNHLHVTIGFKLHCIIKK